MVCTNDADLYETVRMLRSHGMVRELDSESRKTRVCRRTPRPQPRIHLRPCPATTCAARRSTRSSAARSCSGSTTGIRRRTENLLLFLDNLDPDAYRTDFAIEGSSNYAFTLILKAAGPAAVRARHGGAAGQRRRVPARHGRRRQPGAPAVPAPAAGAGRVAGDYPHADHVHFYGFYIGNYPTLERERDPAAVRTAQRPSPRREGRVD